MKREGKILPINLRIEELIYNFCLKFGAEMEFLYMNSRGDFHLLSLIIGRCFKVPNQKKSSFVSYQNKKLFF